MMLKEFQDEIDELYQCKKDLQKIITEYYAPPLNLIPKTKEEKDKFFRVLEAVLHKHR